MATPPVSCRASCSGRGSLCRCALNRDEWFELELLPSAHTEASLDVAMVLHHHHQYRYVDYVGEISLVYLSDHQSYNDYGRVYRYLVANHHHLPSLNIQRTYWFSKLCDLAYSVFGVITEAPQLIEVQALGARVLRVRWTPVSSSPSIPVTGYRLNASTIVNESTTVEFVEEVGANLTTFIFYGLSPYEYRDTQGVTYSVSLLAFNIDGDGPLSNQDVILPRT